MKNLSVVLSLLLLSSSLAGCASWSKHNAGTAVGGVAGGIAGNLLTGGSALGTVAGAAGGAYVGNRMSKR
ncbi:MAG: glycine zipper 2TM domain-containing protein [Gammaproteobacteria bacterium]